MDIQVQIQYNIGNTLTVSNDPQILARTYLSDNYNPGTVDLTVENSSDFQAFRLAMIENIGSENAEFVELSTVSSPTTISILSTPTLFPHNRGGVINLIDYDQIVVYKSATQNGSYVPFNTFYIQATLQTTTISDPTGLSTDWYKLQYKNSVSGNTSDFTAPHSPSVLDPNSVGNMFNSLKTAFGVSNTDPIITTEFLLTSLNEARQFMNNKMAGFKQGWREKFEFPIQLMAGSNFVNLPDDYDYNFTNNALLACRYPRINGLAPYPLSYVDKREWNATAYSLKYSYTVGTTISAKLGYTAASGTFLIGETIVGLSSGFQATIGEDNGTILSIAIISGTYSPGEQIQGQITQVIATGGAFTSGANSLQIQNIGDFAPFPNNNAASTIFIATTSLTQRVIQVNYTGINLATNTFTGVTGIARDLPPGIQVFAFPTFTSATYYTVYQDYQTKEGRIVFNRPIPDIMQGRNLYIDYYTAMVPVNDINTTLPEPYAFIYPYYIRYAIKYRRDNSTSIQTDPDYTQFTGLVQAWIDNHYIGQLQKVITR